MAERGLDVCALVLNYRGAEMTMQVVRDLLADDAARVSVVVIDNGSGADEQRALQAEVAALAPSDHEVSIVLADENLGFAAAMSRGIRDAAERGFEHVLVCNNDLRVPAGAVRTLLDVLRNDPRLGAVGPTIVNPDGTVWAEGGEVGFSSNALRLRRQGRRPTDVSAGPKEVDFLTGAFVMLRVDALKGNIRETDFAARFGGDEFCILLPQTTPAEAVQTALRIRKRVSGMSVSDSSYQRQVTVSIGVDSYDGRKASSVEKLRTNANRALQEAKRRGKNQVWLFSGAETTPEHSDEAHD